MLRPSPIVALAWATAVVLAPALSQVAAQSVEDKRQLEHADYDLWNSVAGFDISGDGKWSCYIVQPGDGDATLRIREIESDREYSVLRGQAPQFSFDSRFLVYTIAPDPEAIRKLKAEKKDPKEFPQPALEILELKSGKHTTISRVASFAMPEKAAGWIAFKMIESPASDTVKESKSELTETFEVTGEGLRRKTATERELEKQTSQSGEKNSEKSGKEGNAATSGETAVQEKGKPGQVEKPVKPVAEAGETEKDKKDKKEKKKEPGTTLVLRNLESRAEQRFPNVVQYRFDKAGKSLAFTSSAENTDLDGVQWFDLEKLDLKQLLSGRGNYGPPVIDEEGRQIAFLTDRDDYQADKPSWSLYLWKPGQREATRIAAAETKGVPQGWWVSSSSDPLFSKDGRRLFFATAPKPEEMENKEEDPLADPVAKLDIWHWQDPFLQPQQLLQVERDRNRDYRAVYDIAARRVVQLATLEMPSVSVDRESAASLAVGISPDKYNKMRSWDVQAFADSYLVDLKTGAARLVLDKSRGIADLSPAGQFITWWDGEKQSWFALPTRLDGGGKLPNPVDLGKGINQPLYDELHDTPDLPGPYGIVGWLDDDKALLLYDRWDIWQVDPTGREKPVCISGGEGRKLQIRFRYISLDPEQRTIDLKQPLLLSVLVNKTKASGYYRSSPGDKPSAPRKLEPLLVMDEDLGGLRKARDNDALLLTRNTFQRCPDLWASTLDFKTMRRISKINPQQDQYLWGTAEVVHWKATDGQPLEGLLYKPDGFDPQKKYPMLVYFYERNSDNLHSYYAPAAGRSIINFSFYVSRGYVLFVPDIPYRTGEPGPSAANAILPGVKSIVDQGFIDEKRIGMQGHSWGGYQTAWLVTQTDMFACAESGAPVSNMTSAYGGIRWGTGMSRMFQYEKTQSRIGDTLWNARDKYIANSPLFFADKIHTPLLILHNDQDTAVPWYQGIELFVALRRLEKPAWMLNYNGDPHWVMSDANRKDFARRMQQFFDHYLKGDPMPVWMAEGLPAVDKGKKFGFEYVVEPETEAEIKPDTKK